MKDDDDFMRSLLKNLEFDINKISERIETNLKFDIKDFA